MTRKSPGTNGLLAPLSGMALRAIPSQDEGLSLRDNPSSCGYILHLHPRSGETLLAGTSFFNIPSLPVAGYLMLPVYPEPQQLPTYQVTKFQLRNQDW